MNHAIRLARYTLNERIMHWLAALSYIYLLLTGLAFYSPRLYWLASMFGGGPTARAWHPLAGLLFSFTIVWMYMSWGRDMRQEPADREWSNKIEHYLKNEDNLLPPAGKYNAGQKQFFWLMVVCTGLLLLSGTVLWFTDYLPWSLRALRYGSVLLHVTAFLLTVAGFIVHVYMGIFIAKGGVEGIVHGEVSEAFAKEHHKLWYDQAVKIRR